MLPAFIFFLIMFGLLLIGRAVILKRYGIPTESAAVAIVSALIIAKVVLVANRIPFLNLYPKKPLIYNVLLKTVVFSILTMLFMFVEELVRLAGKQGGFAPAWAHMTDGFLWSYFLLREAWIFVLVLLYCAGAELARVIGAAKVREIFLGKRRIFADGFYKVAPRTMSKARGARDDLPE